MSQIISVETLLFNVRLSVRYHNRRRAFFDFINLGANFLSVIFGSAAMAALLKDGGQSVAVWAALSVTVTSAVNLVLRSSERARQHHDLAKRFITLEQKTLPAADEQFADLYAEKLTIEADEPPPLNILAIICHNDQVSAEGYGPDRLISLRWWQRLLAHFVDLPPRPIPPPQNPAPAS